MISVLQTVPGALRWGFFVSTALLLVLLLVWFGYPSYLSSRWEELCIQRQEVIREVVLDEFNDRVNRLAGIADEIGRDSVLLLQLTSNRVEELVAGYEKLSAYVSEIDVNVDIVDPHGRPVAWEGRSVFGTAPEFGWNASDTVVTVWTSGLQTFLVVGRPATTKELTVVISESFDVHLPPVTRFVRDSGFRGSVEERLGTEVDLVYGEGIQDPGGRGGLRVGLRTSPGMPPATVIAPVPTMEAELDRFDGTMRKWLNGVTAFLVAVVAACVIAAAGKRVSSVTSVLAIVVSLWVVRYVWIWLDFPASYIGGALFDPRLYGSPFGGGLATSLGETLISSAVFLASILLVVVWVFRRLQSHDHVPPFGNRGVTVLLGIIASLILMILLRAYGATLRSFVYDSTLQYVEPSDVLPGVEVSLMYVGMFLLTLSLLLVAIGVMAWLWNRLALPRKRQAGSLLLIALPYSLVAAVFMWVNRVPQFPWYTPFLLLAGALGVVVWRSREDAMTRKLFGSVSGIGVLLGLSFIVAIPVHDENIHAKEEERLRLYARQLTRPVDEWLSFVVTESLRGAAEEYFTVAREDGRNEGTALAFPLWARTLMSREGYNSALVLYDTAGHEIDRFSVGLTSYEQTELLKRLFDIDEEALNVVERRVPGGLIKYYGTWGVVRDAENRVQAIAAVLLAASERSLFRGEAPEPLRPFGAELTGRRYQSMFLSEYQDGRLAATNDPGRRIGSLLPQPVLQMFSSGTEEFVQLIETMNYVDYETLYARDTAVPGRVAAISLEVVGLRWHVFNLVKVGVVFLLFFGIVLSVLCALRWSEIRPVLTGFRGKLILAFLVVSILPLIVFGYYNRRFAEERAEVNVTRGLKEDLQLVQQRITNVLFEEEDFARGITDDFCETVAAEFGMDFTVYHRSQVQSSSRPELYQSAILDSRLPGGVFARIMVAGQGFVQTRESIGDLTYAVGYRPVVFQERTLGVIAVPALYRQSELEVEVAERNAFTLAVYSVLLLLTVMGGVVFANQLSRPVRALTTAARQVGEGNLDVRVAGESSGELGDLISTFNEMVAELKHSRDELRNIERELAWKEMAKQVAHEIKNPLTPMKLSVQHLRQAFQDKAPDLELIVRRVTATLTEQIDTLARIATEFSTFARMPERRYERVEIHRLLNEAVQLFREIKGIEIRANFSDTEPVLVADADELRRVFINILRNGVQAMEQGGSISVETRVNAGRCTIRITDTGVGIPPHLLEKAFQPNFSTKSDGMGLGLALAHKAVVDLDGTITLESQVGKGTTVEITLPLSGGAE